MDIARPDLKRKSKRRKILWIAAAILFAAGALLIWRLERPSRRGGYITLKHDGRTLKAFVVSPKSTDKSTIVILVHEVYGLSDWARQMANELADQGFLVVAPDLLSGHGPNGGGYSDFADQDDRVKAIVALDPLAVQADLDAIVDDARQLPNSNGRIAIAGFSWGGWRTFAFATHRNDLSAVFVFYGTGPDDVTTIKAPVYAFYAGEDSDVDATVPATRDAMKAAGKFYDPVIYEGAQHGFMRLAEDPENNLPANKTARDQAFARLINQLRKLN